MFETIDLVPFQFHVAFDLVDAEHVAREQEFVIGLPIAPRASRRLPHTVRDAFQFFRQKIVKILVHWIARMDFVPDPVQTRHQHRREREIRIGDGIEEADLDAFRFRIGGVRNPAGRAERLRAEYASSTGAPRTPGSTAYSCWSTGW